MFNSSNTFTLFTSNNSGKSILHKFSSINIKFGSLINLYTCTYLYTYIKKDDSFEIRDLISEIRDSRFEIQYPD
jgi:hypothetical protein